MVARLHEHAARVVHLVDERVLLASVDERDAGRKGGRHDATEDDETRVGIDAGQAADVIAYLKSLER